MALLEQVHLLLGLASLFGLLSTYPFTASAIAYRHRDNGLAYLVMVMGVGIWNGMLVAQLTTTDPAVTEFFFTLSTVGAVLAALGWFLFATTASSTTSAFTHRTVYGTVAILVGIDIFGLVTAPVHSMYWVVAVDQASLLSLAEIVPTIGYWYHTVLLVGLLGWGGLLFHDAWRAGRNVRYMHGYVGVTSVLIIAIIGSVHVAPGGSTLAPVVAVGMTSIGWMQAERGRVRNSVRKVMAGLPE